MEELLEKVTLLASELKKTRIKGQVLAKENHLLRRDETKLESIRQKEKTPFISHLQRMCDFWRVILNYFIERRLFPKTEYPQKSAHTLLLRIKQLFPVAKLL